MEQPLTPPEKQDEPRETFPRGTGRRRVCLVCNDAPREDESLYCFDCHAEGRRRERSESEQLKYHHMDLKTFDFPKTTWVDIAFPTFDAIPALLIEAKERGYDGYDNKPHTKLVSKLFFIGGKVKFLPDVDPEFKDKAWPYVRAFMRSWSPSHEDKVAICALILSELVEPELEEAA